MTKKAKIWMIVGIVMANAIPVGAIIALSAVSYISHYTTPKGYYPDEQSFHRYRGLVIEVDPTNMGELVIGSIEPLDEGVDYPARYYNNARVFCSDIDSTWGAFRPEKGLRFEFTGALKDSTYNWTIPIVEIVVDGQEILSYQEGKAAFLSWAEKQ